jgi:N-acetylmuramoyl-L-alanine amidase
LVTWGSGKVVLLLRQQDNARWRRRGAAIALTIFCVACASRTAPPDAAAAQEADLNRAHELADAGAPLPSRAEALALAESIEARAVREGAGARALELHVGAAALLERVWRVEGRDQDAKEALDLYRAGAHDPDVAGACDAALRAALLAGDVSHDAATTYAELYRVQRRFASSGPDGASPRSGAASRPGDAGPPAPPGSGQHQSDAGVPLACRATIDRALDMLAGFRPPQRVLDAIDDGLAGEGAIAQALTGALDAGEPAAKAPQVVRIEAWPGRDAARVVVVLDRPAAYRVGDEVLAGTASPRTFVDLDGVDLGAAPRDTPSTGLVTRVRAEATSTGSRVSLDLEGHAWRRVFYMHEPYRIVVDVARHPPGTEGHGTRAVSRVVLDPGHGGKDTGAVGPGNVREKDVTLDIAHRAAPVLAGQGMQVVLTRDDDRFVSLEERTARANAFGADLFLSIHCNASESKARRGIETYVLDTTRDEIAGRVAARENATTQAASAELASILGGMRLADQATRSTKFAQLLQRSAMATVGLKFADALDGGVHTAGFYVLVGARMPGVLFEASYISNTTEEQRLGTEEYRQLLADAIANAVKAYREGR